MHSILFTGHMIDKAGRAQERFPKYKEMAATTAIENRVASVLLRHGKNLIGTGSGASGGDIIFHEQCLKKNIRTEMYLPLPLNEFKKQSVSFAGDDWDKRFDALIKKIPVHIINVEKGRNIWAEGNIKMFEAAVKAGTSMTIIALWDLKAGDGIGGTEHMVQMAKKNNYEVEIIDINKI